jgi:hypothetical protein
MSLPYNRPPAGVPTNRAPITFDLPSIFREAVDLADAIYNDAGKPDVISDRLIGHMNPRGRKLSPYPAYGSNGAVSGPGWGQEIEWAPQLTIDAQRALISLALAVADLDGPCPHSPTSNDSQQWNIAGELLCISSTALWVAMDDTEREAVGSRVRQKAQRILGWANPPTQMPDGLQGWDTRRNIDADRWRTAEMPEGWTQWVAPLTAVSKREATTEKEGVAPTSPAKASTPTTMESRAANGENKPEHDWLHEDGDQFGIAFGGKVFHCDSSERQAWEILREMGPPEHMKEKSVTTIHQRVARGKNMGLEWGKNNASKVRAILDRIKSGFDLKCLPGTGGEKVFQWVRIS